jgi:hypothetical protein
VAPAPNPGSVLLPASSDELLHELANGVLVEVSVAGSAFLVHQEEVGDLERVPFAGHRSGLLAYYGHPITTAALEGTNTKIRLLQRQAYGFRDMEFFRLKIRALHDSKIALVG